MAKVEFLYDGQKIDIYCNENDKFNNIIIKFSQKVQKNKDDLCFLYGGQVVNVNTTFNGLANSIDKKRKIISIIATNNYAGNNSTFVKENKQLKEKLEIVNKEINEQKAEIQNLKNKMAKVKEEGMTQINSLLDTIEKKDAQIKKLKIQLKNMKEPEKVTINFMSADQKINYPMVCEPNESFASVEDKLYKKFPEYRESNNHLLYNGAVIQRFKTVKENKIRNGATILLMSPEYDY